MTCPTDRYGRSKCHITAHPDHPHDKFCSTCKQRFYEAEHWYSLGLFILGLFILIFIIVNQTQQNPKPQSNTPTIKNTEFIIYD
jgi:hypothetical protein